MMDAFDVWLQQSPVALLRRYEELADGGVVVGADKGCWPNEWDSVCQRCPCIPTSNNVCGMIYQIVCQGVPESPLPIGTFGPGAEGHAQNK